MRRVVPTNESLITPATELPITLSFVKEHIKSVSDEDDYLLTAWINAAVEQFQAATGRQLIEATWEYWLDFFPDTCKIELPHPPLLDVISVEYADGSGDYVSFSDGGSPDVPYWQFSAPSGPYARRGYIEPISGMVWPVAACQAGAVKITYTAGYGGDPDDVPDLVRSILCLMIANLDQFRSETHLSERGAKLERLPFGMQQLLDEFKYSAMPSTLLMGTQTCP
jgi:uncharacterized phiE125 gp8 family phage protein